MSNHTGTEYKVSLTVDIFDPVGITPREAVQSFLDWAGERAKAAVYEVVDRSNGREWVVDLSFPEESFECIATRPKFPGKED